MKSLEMGLNVRHKLVPEALAGLKNFGRIIQARRAPERRPAQACKRGRRSGDQRGGVAPSLRGSRGGQARGTVRPFSVSPGRVCNGGRGRLRGVAWGVKYFAGSYTHKLDAKGRVSLPVAFRKALTSLDSEYIVLVPQYFSEDYHVGLSQAGHEAAIEDAESRDDIDDEARHEMLGALVADAHLLAPDDAGRIVLPRELREALGLKGEVLFKGLGSHFEIWNPARHGGLAEQRQQVRRSAPKASLRRLH